MATKRVTDNLDRGMWADYGHPEDGYFAAVGRTEARDEEPYFISYHKGAMPAFDGEVFATVDELEAAMREIEPDLRKWRLVELDG